MVPFDADISRHDAYSVIDAASTSRLPRLMLASRCRGHDTRFRRHADSPLSLLLARRLYLSPSLRDANIADAAAEAR